MNNDKYANIVKNDICFSGWTIDFSEKFGFKMIFTEKKTKEEVFAAFTSFMNTIFMHSVKKMAELKDES